MKSLTMNVIPYANTHKNTNFNVANGNLKIGHQDGWSWMGERNFDTLVTKHFRGIHHLHSNRWTQTVGILVINGSEVGIILDL